ncbi:hypothetical protein HYC85_013862 [Camellia sinensis]|uniref:DRBM domain-containing protein n=1 Tax=Camellia sinensis TaxID=4442 RepID=A0A7J7H5V7_CAMSI|nr:hypothetical protein HYC85_013862 [Camellia sinensis]
MYKNQLQELAQRSCFNLPSYMCIREGPDHAPRFKATVNFNGETFESPSFCTTLRQAEHSAAGGGSQCAVESRAVAFARRQDTDSISCPNCRHDMAFPVGLFGGLKQIVYINSVLLDLHVWPLHRHLYQYEYQYPISTRSEYRNIFGVPVLRSLGLLYPLRVSVVSILLYILGYQKIDETGVYKNLLQEVSQRVEASLPIYTTFRSGLGHLPVFSCTVELAGVRFTGEPAKNKKQAEKNAAMAAWSCLKLSQKSEGSSEKVNNDEQEHVTVARALQSFLRKAKMCNNPRPLTTQPSPMRSSKILPLICSKTVPQSRPVMTPVSNSPMFPKTGSQSRPVTADAPLPSPESPRVRPQKFPATGAEPYIPVRHFRGHYGIAPPVTIRNAIPVFSAPPLPPPLSQSPQLRLPPSCIAPPVCVRQAVPVLAAPACVEEQPISIAPPTPVSWLFRTDIEEEECSAGQPAGICGDTRLARAKDLIASTREHRLGRGRGRRRPATSSSFLLPLTCSNADLIGSASQYEHEH